MSRGHNSPSTGRALGVWLVVTTGVLTTWAVVAGSATTLASIQTWHGTFEDLLVAVASAALACCAGWLWLVTTVTVLDVLRGRVSTTAPHGFTRRLVLAACGAAMVAGIGSPALAGAGGSDHSIGGLPLPDRAVSQSASRPAPSPDAQPVPQAAPRRTPVQAPAQGSPAAITVRDGDSLWSIAAGRLGPQAGEAEIDAAWRELYAANREAIGTDPDLIVPGLDLEPDHRPSTER